jgi:DNA invertase Pin-like site-specific DNA recombinase
MNCAIYARKSNEQNGVADEAKSVARQIEHSRAYALKKGWSVADEHIYVDDGISGAVFSGRPGYVRLLNALKPKPPFGVLVMSEESRLRREQIEVSSALKQLVASGVRVFCYLTDSERTLNSPVEKAMLALQTMADEMEREKARQRSRDAALQRARHGYVTGGDCYGYASRHLRAKKHGPGRRRRRPECDAADFQRMRLRRVERVDSARRAHLQRRRRFRRGVTREAARQAANA